MAMDLAVTLPKARSRKYFIDLVSAKM